ncbi:T9SS C-terminal target domain-containing protein [Candidatus Sumerlaeota bacterium]|nr:T9SS C-terminal target domain-containing protein [Candidatus Sumerlaeota bacterium]
MRAIYSILLVLITAWGVPTNALAEHIKVDMSVSGQSQGGATGFTPWWVVNAVTDTQTETFSGITCTIDMTSPSLTSTQYLRCSYNGKDGITYDYKLAYDAIWPHWKPDPPDMPYPNGGAMTLTLEGLPTGTHNIVTYHNNPWAQGVTPSGWDRVNNMSNTQIFVDGVYVKTITPTYLVTNDADCGYAFFAVDAVAGTPVVIGLVPDGSQTVDTVFLNGFEIDAPGEPSGMASLPVPADEDMHVDVHNDDPGPGEASNGYTTLSWTPSVAAVSHDVYLGTDETDVSNATPTTPGVFKGNQAGTTYAATGLSPLHTYYWRIDEVDGVGGTTPGLVWIFRPRRVAFPTAEGWGRFAVGGRGGSVIHVTNLNDSGPGSLRAAVEAEGPRTVVFDVSGVIALNSRLVMNNNTERDNSYCTVAGQTAPGKGICIRDYDFGTLGPTDVIIRHVRVRVGKEIGTDKTLGGMGMGSSNHCVMDHCSISWSQDEAFSSRAAGNITLQRTLISEALHVAGHNNYPPGTSHGFAGSIGGSVATFHHNLLAHCEGRNWSLAGGLDPSSVHTGSLDIRNNVVYNWDGRTTDGGAKEVNFVRNYYKPGPATDSGPYTELNPQFENPGFGPQQYYVEGNVMEGHHGPEGPLPPFDGVAPQGTQPWPVTVPDPFFEHYVTTHSAADAYTNVLADVGCNKPMLDDHDTRIVTEVTNGTYTYSGSVTSRPGLPDNQADVGGWETYPEEHRPAGWDSDQDGMPNWWEEQLGLNPNDSSDGNGDPDGDGYTNLEFYLNYMAGDVGEIPELQPGVDSNRWLLYE